jgi:hypothetical protein
VTLAEIEEAYELDATDIAPPKAAPVVAVDLAGRNGQGPSSVS